MIGGQRDLENSGRLCEGLGLQPTHVCIRIDQTTLTILSTLALAVFHSVLKDRENSSCLDI